ncbi:hypothetical protein [Streptomyces sp. NPDC048737]|uniref:hypothetical protein n=1 Tax=unclassified Streptomyces TaxID=2593676 RepID=UPI00343B1EE7
MAVRSTEAENILKAVLEIVPTLRGSGVASKDQRWTVQGNIDLLEKAGVFRIAVPKHFGGLELPLEEQVEIITGISRGCGSTGRVAVAWISSTWMATPYPPDAREEIFAGGSVRVSGGFTPTAKMVPAEGGRLLNGAWRFGQGRAARVRQRHRPGAAPADPDPDRVGPRQDRGRPDALRDLPRLPPGARRRRLPFPVVRRLSVA